MKWEREIEERNRPLSDEELDAMLPGEKEGYKILPPPPGYVPIQTPARKLMATPTPFGQTPLYQIPEEDRWAWVGLFALCGVTHCSPLPRFQMMCAPPGIAKANLKQPAGGTPHKLVVSC